MTLPPSPKSPARQKDPFERDRLRLSRYRELRDFYDGTQWLGKARRGEKRLVVNYARALVRKVVSYALPDAVGFEVPAPVLHGSGVGGRRSDEDGKSEVGRRTSGENPDLRLDRLGGRSGAGARGGGRGAGQ